MLFDPLEPESCIAVLCVPPAILHSGLSPLVARYQGCFLLGNREGCALVIEESTHCATLAAKVISLSNSLLLFLASIVADHFAVRIATMRHVAIGSDGPIFGQSGTSL